MSALPPWVRLSGSRLALLLLLLLLGPVLLWVLPWSLVLLARGLLAAQRSSSIRAAGLVR